MCPRQFLIHVISALLQFFLQVYGNKTVCSVEVQVQRNSCYYKSSGESVLVYCPVKFCPGKRPSVTWCKLYGEQCIPLQEELNTITTKWTQEKETATSGNFILKFVIAQPNNTGLYRCEAEDLGGGKSVSHTVLVNITVGYVTEPENSTEPPNTSAKKNLLWQVYVFASLAILCLLIITCTFLLYISLRRSRAKHKTAQETLQAGTNMITGAVSFHPIDIFTSTENVQDSADYSSMMDLPQGSRDETIYDNDALPSWKHNPTGPAPNNDGSACNSNGLLVDDEDVIFYAALNHTGHKTKPFQRGPGAELEPTEYAAICVRT